MGLLETLNQHTNKGLMVKLRYDDFLKTEIINNTQFLPEESSLSERVYCLKNNITEQLLCPVCNKPRKFRNMNTGYFATCGDKSCQTILHCQNVTIANKTRNYTESVKKAKATYKERTGYEHNMQNPEFKKQFFDSLEAKAGIRYPIASDKAKEHRERTFLEKYGTTDIAQILHSEQAEQTIIDRYGSLEAYYNLRIEQMNSARKDMTRQEITERLDTMGYDYIRDEDRFVIAKCHRCQHEFQIPRQSVNINFRSQHFTFCPHCDYKDNTYRSNFEKDVLNEVRELLPDKVIHTNMHFGQYEVDIYIPDLKLVIECNGLYWHSELYKDTVYHYKKKQELEEKFGLHVVYIWEDTWFYQHNIVIDRLKAKMGLNETVYARKCIIKTVSAKDAREFLESYHIQGYVNSSINYGLYYNNELAEIITLGKSRKAVSKQNDCEYELYRLCSKPGINVVGGFSKLIKAFKEEYNGKIISFVDLSWSDIAGASYKKAGFEVTGKSGPEYWWFNKKNRAPIRENRLRFQKHKLVDEGYDNSKSEIEIMHDRGYLRVFGPGNLIAVI